MSKAPATGKFKRGAISGLALVHAGINHLGHTARQFARDDEDKIAAQEQHEAELGRILFRALNQLKGTALKVSQLLSMEADFLPAGIRRELAKGCYQVTPLNRALIHKVFTREFGLAPEAMFAQFEAHSFAAASLGQVHRATLANGTKVAVKVQYPGIASSIGSDMAAGTTPFGNLLGGHSGRWAMQLWYGSDYNASMSQNLSIPNGTYALHFDAGRVAEYLAAFALKNGVKRLHAHVEKVSQHDDERIKNLVLKNGEIISGDFFIDCTGQRALLIGDSLGVNYVNWSHYLPVNRAAVVQSENLGALPPYTEAFAHEHGWRWQIPLQNRTGNGYVYCSDYCSEQEAVDLLLKNIKGKPLNEPLTINFTTGKREKMWHQNCVAIGLSSGFLEPLESISIYLIMRAALNFIAMLPNESLAQATQDEYNRLMDIEYECLRDFIVAHYCTSERVDSDFWRSWLGREIPLSLRAKLALYKSQGRLIRNDLDLFASNSWHAVLSGMGVLPDAYDPLVDSVSYEQMQDFFNNAKDSLAHSVGQLLTHEEYLSRVIAR